MKCKECVEKEHAANRAAASERQLHQQPADGEQEKRQCIQCAIELPFSAFNKSQWSKGEGQSRCRDCVERRLADEKAQQTQAREAKLTEARDRVAKAKASGKASELLVAESQLAALEAEMVTGLKPVRLSGRGRGRQGGQRSSSGRGRK